MKAYDNKVLLERYLHKLGKLLNSKKTMEQGKQSAELEISTCFLKQFASQATLKKCFRLDSRDHQRHPIFTVPKIKIKI